MLQVTLLGHFVKLFYSTTFWYNDVIKSENKKFIILAYCEGKTILHCIIKIQKGTYSIFLKLLKKQLAYILAYYVTL